MILAVLVALFTTCLVVSNIIAVKLVAVGDWVVPASAAGPTAVSGCLIYVSARACSRAR